MSSPSENQLVIRGGVSVFVQGRFSRYCTCRFFFRTSCLKENRPMILFPNIKINLGLRVGATRPDGYHDIVTVMVPVGWCDILEITPARRGLATTLTVTGLAPACPPEKNLVMKAFKAVEARCGSLPPVDICLHKIIPDGAGLGGGSSDAAFTVRGLDRLFSLGLSDADMADISATVGSDCPFFIYNRPMLATGRGTDLADVRVNTGGISALAIVKRRGEGVSTAQAYAGIASRADCDSDAARLVDALSEPVRMWNSSGAVLNDFEPSVFARRPDVEQAKAMLSDAGAVFAAMSGSGAAVFGLFENAKMAEAAVAGITDCDTFVAEVPDAFGLVER